MSNVGSCQALLPLSALLLLSCQQLDPAFCASHPRDLDCAGRAGFGIDAGACTVNEQCTDPTPVCDTSRSICVQCTAGDAQACGGTTPVCGTDDSCRGCATDDECASQACLPDASCAAALDVLYVSPDGSDLATCMPDDRCSLARALGLIDGTKSTIRLDPARYDLLNTLALPHDLHLVGRDAVIDRNAAGSGGTLDLAAGTNIAIDYVTIEGGDGSSGFGLRCTNAALTMRDVTIQGNAAAGITANTCALAISHSQILGNQGMGIVASGGDLTLTRSTIAANHGGGVSITAATYDLENDVIVKNGDPSSLFGGVLISQIASVAGHAFAFNTVAQNQATAGTTPGVLCGIITTPLPLTSSIVFDNAAGAQVEGGNCNWTYSDIGPVAVSGTGNRSSNPLFIDPAHNNFHLQVASPARDAADPAATLAVDIDGDPRPQGTGRDMGADEIR